MTYFGDESILEEEVSSMPELALAASSAAAILEDKIRTRQRAFVS